MELSINSWHSKLYNIFYTKGLPQSLCPYFWKLVLAIFLFIPVTLWYFLWIVSTLIIKGKRFEYPVYFTTKNFNNAYVLNGATIILISLVYQLIHKQFWLLITIFVVTILVLIIVSIIIFISSRITFKPRVKKSYKNKTSYNITGVYKSKV